MSQLFSPFTLRDPYWPRHAAQQLGDTLEWPDQYKRADVNAFGK